MEGWRINKTVGIDTIIAIVILIVTVVTYGSALERRQTIVEVQQTWVLKQIEQLAETQKTVAENQRLVTRSLDKLTVLVEQHLINQTKP